MSQTHIVKIKYRVFALLSACALIPTGRKSVLNSEVRLTARCPGSCIQIRMRTRGIYALSKGAWPNARSCDRSRYCMSPDPKRRLLLEAHENRMQKWRFRLTLRCWNPNLAQGIYAVQGQSSFMRLYAKCAYWQRALRPTKQYALISEYFQISNSTMTLIVIWRIILNKEPLWTDPYWRCAIMFRIFNDKIWCLVSNICSSKFWHFQSKSKRYNLYNYNNASMQSTYIQLTIKHEWYILFAWTLCDTYTEYKL